MGFAWLQKPPRQPELGSWPRTRHSQNGPIATDSEDARYMSHRSGVPCCVVIENQLFAGPLQESMNPFSVLASNSDV